MKSAHGIFGAVIAVLAAANVVAMVAQRILDTGTPGGGLIALLGASALLVAVLWVAAFVIRGRTWMLRLALRVVLVAAFVSALVAFPLWLIARYEALEIPIRQALIAATIVAAGWLVTFLVQEYRRESDREESRADVRRAVRTEIELHYVDVHDTDWKGLRAVVEDQFFRDSRYVPFVPRRDRDRFLSTVLSRVEMLSEKQIVRVMRYYELAERLEMMNEDVRSDQYRAMSVDRRRALFLSFIELEETCMKYALEAIESLSPPRYFQQFTEKFPRRSVNRTDPATSGPEGEA